MAIAPGKVFYGLFETVAAKAVGRKKFRFKNKLVSLDSTVIDLCLSMYDWAKFRRTKGAVKLHLVLGHDGYLPCFGIITEGKVAEVKAAHQMHFAPDTIVVDDRGYNDFRLFNDVLLVTRGYAERGLELHEYFVDGGPLFESIARTVRTRKPGGFVDDNEVLEFDAYLSAVTDCLADDFDEGRAAEMVLQAQENGFFYRHARCKEARRRICIAADAEAVWEQAEHDGCLFSREAH